VSHYIRFVLTDEKPVLIEELESALRRVNEGYAIDGGVITFDGIELGLIDITQRGDPICDDDLDLLTRQAEKKHKRDLIQASLRNAMSLLCVQLLNAQDAKSDDALAPLWDWRLANREGLLASEGGYFFNRAGESM
jgi:hypothetical protein